MTVSNLTNIIFFLTDCLTNAACC